MANESVTPNIGLQIPGFNQANWQVPINYDLNLLDLIFGGAVTVPALSVETLLVTGSLGELLGSNFVSETPSGSVPGNVFNCSVTPSLMIAVFVNGLFQRPTLDYALSGAQITLNLSLSSGDTIYALYFK